MKTFLLLVGLLYCNLLLQGQTKGTNAIGFGINMSSNDVSYFDGSEFNQSQSSYSLTYGHFFADNQRLSLKGVYLKSKYDNRKDVNTTESYGSELNYQKYFSVINKLFVYTGGGLGYQSGEEFHNYFSTELSMYKYHQYRLNASAGVAYFLSKRIAFEAQLLSLNAGYTKSKVPAMLPA